MKGLMLILGVCAMAMGLLWVGQGLGFIQWPASSFMIDQTQWAYYGAILALVGLVMIVVARR